jgi:hypothetical protein
MPRETATAGFRRKPLSRTWQAWPFAERVGHNDAAQGSNGMAKGASIEKKFTLSPLAPMHAGNAV